jgi:hypothetical protein
LDTFSKITKVCRSPHFCAAFFHGRVYALFFLTKTGWATFWAIFFTDSSGHPDSTDESRKEYFIKVSPGGVKCIVVIGSTGIEDRGFESAHSFEALGMEKHIAMLLH